MRAFLTFVFVLLALPVTAQDQRPMMTISAEGRVDAAPDLAVVSVGVINQSDTAGAALRANSAQLADVFAILEAEAVESRDIQTSGLSLNPMWDNSSLNDGKQPRIAGYQVSNTVTVRVRDLDKLGSVLDRLVSGGANQMNGLSFGLADPGPAEDEARRRAVAEALRKAELFAAAAGVTLGPVQSITEGGGYQEPRPMLRQSAAMESVPVAEGELSVTAQVTISFAIGG